MPFAGDLSDIDVVKTFLLTAPAQAKRILSWLSISFPCTLLSYVKTRHIFVTNCRTLLKIVENISTDSAMKSCKFSQNQLFTPELKTFGNFSVC